MLEEKDGWYIVNVKDAPWSTSPEFGQVCSFETEGVRFPHTGVRIWVVEPGKSNCMYHRENGQEDFLVLSGKCRLLVNGEEKSLNTWDYVHCPPGVSHVFVGDGDGPCALLAIGHRPGEGNERLCYPTSELARQYNAEAPEPTPDPKVAYSDVEPRAKSEPPEWPIRVNVPFSSGEPPSAKR